MKFIDIILNSITKKVYALSINPDDIKISSLYGVEPVNRFQASFPKTATIISILIAIVGILVLLLKKGATKKVKKIIIAIIVTAAVIGIICGIRWYYVEKTMFLY